MAMTLTSNASVCFYHYNIHNKIFKNLIQVKTIALLHGSNDLLRKCCFQGKGYDVVWNLFFVRRSQQLFEYTNLESIIDNA